MPILAQEPEIYPADLLSRPETGQEEDRQWWALYTMSRREKELMRRLRAMELSFYCPVICHRQRSPAGRIRQSFLPIFTNYVFLYGRAEDRYQAFTSNCISRDIPVPDGVQLTRDLLQFYRLIEAGVPLTPESRLVAGQRVVVRTGAFRGYEGCIVRREGETRLLVSVNFLQKGASLLLDNCEVEPA
jgi:transcription antitermination factor NusG